MRLMFLICVFILTASCSDKPQLHLADLKKSPASSSEIILFEDQSQFDSTEPSHNVVPTHGNVEKGRTLFFLEGNCIEMSNYRFCGDNDRLNSRLKMSVTWGNQRVYAKPLGGSIFDILYRFISPSPTIYQIIRFGQETFGLLHSYGFSVFQSEKFCDPVAVNPNSKISFGVDKQGVPLIFSSAPLTKVDRRVDGWREYEIARLCQ